MNTPQPLDMRRCVLCWQKFPLDAAHFDRLSGRVDFLHQCRVCGERAQQRVVAPIQDGRDWS